jgi:general secretion pathway protein I
MSRRLVIQSPSRDSAEGFTLIEMIVALAILSISLGVLFGAFSQDMDRQRLNRTQMSARLLAQALLNQSAVSDAQTTGVRHGVSPDGLSWTVAVTPYGERDDRRAWRATPAGMTATVEWSLDGHRHHVALTTLRFMHRDESP